MLDIVLLGTSGTVPLPNRWLTSCYLRNEGNGVLIDCGEGTQIALNSHRISFKHINTILLTHYHADHTSGLPGLLLSMAKADRTEPITIIGPKGLEEILGGITTIARYIPFAIQYRELYESVECFEIDHMHITAFSLRHSVPCYGYKVEIERGRKFLKEKAEALDVPLQYWSRLQKGESINENGKTYVPDMVLGPKRKGISFVYATDTRPMPILQEMAYKADLLIAEGMYGDEEKIENAYKNKHMMMQEAATIAKEAEVNELWFTHYSPSMVNPNEYEEEVKAIFSSSVISKDGQSKTLRFMDEGEA